MIKCELCGTEFQFESKYKKNRYCSRACAMADFGRRTVETFKVREKSICEVAGCGDFVNARRLCSTHYKEARRNKNLPPKRCPCGAELPEETRGRGRCASCLSLTKKRAILKRLYGIDELEYLRLAAEQNNRCAICGKEQSGEVGDRLAVDHDHADDSIRGLLCTNCNPGLGFFNDDPVLLRSAAEYLEQRVRA